MNTGLRNTIRLEVCYGTDGQCFNTDYSVDMSTGGVFLATDTILPVDTPLVIKFKLPGTDAIIVCDSRVAWTNEPGNLKKSSLPPGMGIQFNELYLENTLKIRDLLK